MNPEEVRPVNLTFLMERRQPQPAFGYRQPDRWYRLQPISAPSTNEALRIAANATGERTMNLRVAGVQVFGKSF